MRDSANESTSAMVLGASMAGLLAARVLTRHFGRVVVVERDDLPDQAAPRRGVPQGNQTHGLLAAGCRTLERLFPGISDELVALGAVAGDSLVMVRWHIEGDWLPKTASGLEGMLVSRPGLERAIRNRVRALRNVEFRTGLAAEDLVFDDARERVIGVRVGRTTISADLVVDATGRGSRAPQWLQANGYTPPPEEKVEVGIGYTTRFFKRDLAYRGEPGIVMPPTPTRKQGGAMLAQEGERWIVTLFSCFGPKAPEDLAGFIDFARRLPQPEIYDVIRAAEPLGDAAHYNFPSSVRRRYESLSRFPEGLLVIGDGLCGFNPVYGQGMSVAALEAMELDDVLARGRHALAGRFFRRAAAIIDNPWSIAVGGDLRMAEVKAPRNPAIRILNWYMANLHTAAHRDPEVARAFGRVMNLVAAPSSLLQPRLAARVLWAHLPARKKKSAPPPMRATA